jgi:hypothetical protein
MEHLNKRYQTLIDIFNIPLMYKWSEWSNPDQYTVYKYWHSLGLLNQTELDRIFTENCLKPTSQLKKFFIDLDYHFRPKFYHRGAVADVGSGFGFITFWLLLSGAEKVFSIGDEKRINFIEQLYQKAVELKLLEAGKLSVSPKFVKDGDISLAENIQDGSLSLVLLNDTLEHITPRIFPSLVKASYNNLANGGYFISRQQNTDSKKVFNNLISYWKNSEEQIFINQRLEIINKSISGIDADEAFKLAKHTRGMDSTDFYQSIKDYKTDKTIPGYNEVSPPIDIITDVPDEGDTGIARIISEFKKNNFTDVSVYPDFLASRKSAPFQIIAKKIPNIFLKNDIFATSTVFIARK